MRSMECISRIVRLAFVSLVAGLLAGVLFTSAAVAQPNQAPATPTPTPTPIPTRKVGWLNSAAARAPQGLQRTVILPGGAGGGEDDCSRILLAPGTDAWFISAPWIVVNVPHHKATLSAMYCGADPDPAARFFLTDPAGNSWELSGFSNGAAVEYEFSPDAATGEYRLTISTFAGRFDTKFNVTRYTGARLTLWDVATLTPGSYFLPGQSMYADFFGFAPGARLEVGFYRTSPDGGGTTLVDLWQVVIGPNGRFFEILPIPANAPFADYALIACELSACKPYLDREYGRVATNVDWAEFAVTDYAFVADTAGAAGLPMWSSLGAGTQTARTLLAGEEVRVLEGPRYQQNRPWYRVQHPDSQTQGWMDGTYLTAGWREVP